MVGLRAGLAHGRDAGHDAPVTAHFWPDYPWTRVKPVPA
jgi:hypothetical protein